MKPFNSRRLGVEGYEDEGVARPGSFTVRRHRGENGRGNHHPTVKPLRLCQYLAKLILPPAGFRKLLVPYCGSGSEMIGCSAGRVGLCCRHRTRGRVRDHRQGAARLPECRLASTCKTPSF